MIILLILKISQLKSLLNLILINNFFKYNFILYSKKTNYKLYLYENITNEFYNIFKIG